MRSETAISMTDILLHMPFLNTALLILAGLFSVTATFLLVLEVRTQLRETTERAPIRPLSVTPVQAPED